MLYSHYFLISILVSPQNSSAMLPNYRPIQSIQIFEMQLRLYVRVVFIFQKLRHPKDQVMWSNTMLWDMFIRIFKLLTLKLSNHWIAQFYEAISLNFRLIKYSDAWKLTFFSLKISWNDFKVIYAWIEVKKCLQAKFGVIGVTEWDSMGVQKH